MLDGLFGGRVGGLLARVAPDVVLGVGALRLNQIAALALAQVLLQLLDFVQRHSVHLVAIEPDGVVELLVRALEFAFRQTPPCAAQETQHLGLLRHLLLLLLTIVVARRIDLHDGRSHELMRHAAVELRVVIIRRQIEIPSRVLERHIQLRRLQLHVAFRFRKRLAADVDQLDGHRSVIRSGTLQREQQRLSFLAWAHRLSGDEGRPDARAFWQLDAQMLKPVVANVQRHLGHHLAVVRDDRGEARIVHERLQHRRFVETFDLHAERVAGPQIAIDQHRHFSRRVRSGSDSSPRRQLAHIDADERFGRGLLGDLQRRLRQQHDRAGLAFHVERLHAGEAHRVGCGAVRLRGAGLVPRHHQRVAAAHLVLQFHAPEVVRLVATPDVRAVDFHVGEVRRHAQLKLLHRRVLNVVAHQRAAAHQRLVQRHEVHHLGAHPRLNRLRRERKFPRPGRCGIAANKLVGQHAAAAAGFAFAQDRRWNLRQPVKSRRPHRDSRLARHGDEARELLHFDRRRAGEVDGFRQLFVRLHQRDRQAIAAQRALLEIHFQRARSRLLVPLRDAISAHALDLVAVRQRQSQREHARLLDRVIHLRRQRQLLEAYLK